MEKKQYNAPAIVTMSVHAEAVLAAASPEIPVSPDKATEEAGSKRNDFDDFDDLDDEYADSYGYGAWQ